MFFIDSSVLIEGFKSKGITEAQKLVKFLITRVDLLELGINSIVFSETVYQLINKKKGHLILRKDIFLSYSPSAVSLRKMLIFYQLQRNL